MYKTYQVKNARNQYLLTEKNFHDKIFGFFGAENIFNAINMYEVNEKCEELGLKVVKVVDRNDFQMTVNENEVWVVERTHLEPTDFEEIYNGDLLTVGDLIKELSKLDESALTDIDNITLNKVANRVDLTVE